MTRKLLIFLLTASWVFGSIPAHALERFDFEQKYFRDPGYPVLDHYIVETPGEYHLFYLRGNPAVSIGHATTTDFIHYTLQPPVLSPGTWDDLALWAPHLIRYNGLWYMFFTGVNKAFSQQTGVAVSTDLYNWTQIPWPLYHPPTTWAEWTETGFAHGRDPDVLENDGTFYQFVTAKTNTNRGAVACATSNNLITWTDIGPVLVNTTWHVLESVFVMKYNNRWRMFFTEETVSGTSYIGSDSLLTGWNMNNRRIVDFGHAAQVTVTSSGAQLFSRHAVYTDGLGVQHYTIRVDTLAWTNDLPGVVKPWPLAANWKITSGNAFYFQPVWMDNPGVRGDTTTIGYEGNCWIGTGESFTGPLGFGNAGDVQSDASVGTLQSRTFTLSGRSMNLLVGGGNDPVHLYVALVDSATGAHLFSETGRGTDHMDRRYWDTLPYLGQRVYIEISDQATGAFGHINVDDIVESTAPLDGSTSSGTPGDANTKTRKGLKTTPGSGFPATSNAPAGRATLYPSVPNPFNPATTIRFDLPRAAGVTLSIYSVSGQLVRTLVRNRRPAGSYSVEWNGHDLRGQRVPSGVYFYRLVVDGRPLNTRKMVLLK